ncbi:MlaD family protein [Nocardia gipuzkoensis]|jgi:phospholipid/cholesterol/gamma-HCH transport system substrate-binding protein|nr:MCE family protein [Nocardia abscessus]
MISRTLASVVGMAAVAAASFTYMYDIGMPVSALQDLDTVSMALPETNGLVAGSPVLMRGISVGSVSKVTSSAGMVEVEWKFDRKYRIPVDSRYRVDNLSALGEPYVAVVPATEGGPYLKDHAVIDAARIVVPTTIKELSARLTKLLEQVDPDRLEKVFHEMDIALPDDVQVLGNLSHAGELLASMITEQSDAFGKFLTAIQPILQDSSWLAPDLVAIGPTIPKTARRFSDLWDLFTYAKYSGPITPANRDGTVPFLAETQRFLDDTATDLDTLGTNLLPAAQAGAAALKTVDVGRMLDNALAATDARDSVTVHVRTPGR